MGISNLWDRWHTHYVRCAGTIWWASYRPAAELLGRLTAPLPEDVQWLTEALADDRKWFMADLARRAEGLAEPLFVPTLNAAIDGGNLLVEP